MTAPKNQKEQIEKKVQAEVQKEVKKEVKVVKKEAQIKIKELETKKEDVTELLIKVLNRKDWSLIVSTTSLILNICFWGYFFLLYKK